MMRKNFVSQSHLQAFKTSEKNKQNKTSEDNNSIGKTLES